LPIARVGAREPHQRSRESGRYRDVHGFEQRGGAAADLTDDGLQQDSVHIGMFLTEPFDLVAVQGHRLGCVQRRDGCDAWRGRDHSQLTEVLARSKDPHRCRITERGCDSNSQMTAFDEMQGVAAVPLVEDDLPASELAMAARPRMARV
jgi:hypothetical protein